MRKSSCTTVSKNRNGKKKYAILLTTFHKYILSNKATITITKMVVQTLNAFINVTR